MHPDASMGVEQSKCHGCSMQLFKQIWGPRCNGDGLLLGHGCLVASGKGRVYMQAKQILLQTPHEVKDVKKQQVVHLSPCQFFLAPTTIFKKRLMHFHPWVFCQSHRDTWWFVKKEAVGFKQSRQNSCWFVWMNWGAKMQQPKAAPPAAVAGPIQLALVPCCNWKGGLISYASKNICCKPLMEHKTITPWPNNVEVVPRKRLDQHRSWFSRNCPGFSRTSVLGPELMLRDVASKISIWLSWPCNIQTTQQHC